MKLTKYSKDKVSFSYKGMSIFATGDLAKVITFSIAGLLIMWGIAAIQNVSKNDKGVSTPNFKN